MADPVQTPAPPRGPSPRVLLLLLAVALALRVPELRGPFTDGLRGDCGAFFAIMARNAHALGLSRTHAIPIVDPVPPATLEAAEWYTHHPPGLPLLVTLASTLPVAVEVEVAARLVALALGLVSLLLVADLTARTLGPRAALASGLAMLLLPAGLHHGLLVNYETVAMPAAIAIVRALVLGARPPVLAGLGLVAALCDWIAMLPLVATPPWRIGRARAAGLLGAAAGVGGLALVHRTRVEGSLRETLGHAVGATPLAPDFSAGAWLAALGGHGLALFGPMLLALPLLVARPPFGARAPAALRRALGGLLIVAAANVVLFARHATGHEVYALPFLPPCALLLGWLAHPGPREARARRRGATLRAAAVALVLVAGVGQALAARPERNGRRQATLADAFARVTTTDAVYLTPSGVPLVFLHRAARHVSPYGARDLEQARARLEALRARHDLGPRPGRVFVPEDAPWPAWMGAPPPPRGGFRIAPLPDADG